MSANKSQKISKRIDPLTAKRLLSYITNKYKTQFIIVLVLILLSALSSISLSLFLQILVDDYILPLMDQSVPNFSGLVRAILIMSCIGIGGAFSNLFYSRIMTKITESVVRDIKIEAFSNMQSFPISYFDTHPFGDIMSRFTSDAGTLGQMLSQSIPQIFSALITVTTVFVFMIITSWHLTLFVLLFLIVIMNMARIITGKSGSYFVKRQSDIGELNGYVEEIIHGQKVVKVFNHEEDVKEDFNELNDQLQNSNEKANRYTNILMPIMMNLGNMQYILIAVIGGLLAMNNIGGLTLGAIFTFCQLSRSFTMPINMASQQMNMVVMALAGAGRIFELMDQPSEVDDGYVTLVKGDFKNGEYIESNDNSGVWAWKHPHSDGTISYTQLTGDVRFYDVDFGYTKEKMVLHGITMYAEPSQKIAFVGATGAGKTTISNLINRFYDLADGKIRYDNININKIKKSDLRQSLGVVLQDTHLFTGTVMDNIRYGNLDAKDAEVIDAAKLANADDFITRLPDGYNTLLTNDGENLSQGQRQLLSIARAAVADPPVMILDEATSSIDTRTEALVQKGMDRLMHGRTVFVIAHRLSTIQNSDVIMVMDQGKIIERGNHDELIAQKGRYYELYTGAFELD